MMNNGFRVNRNDLGNDLIANITERNRSVILHSARRAHFGNQNNVSSILGVWDGNSFKK